MIKLEANGSIKEGHVGVNLDFEAEGNSKIVVYEMASVFVELLTWDKGIFTDALGMALRREGIFED